MASSIIKRHKELLDSGKFSDFVITCGGREFKVHRNVICPQSPFLSKLCDSGFKEGLEGRATLHGVDSELFDLVLDFLYSTTYEDGQKSGANATSETCQSLNQTWKAAKLQIPLGSNSGEIFQKQDIMTKGVINAPSPLLVNIRMQQVADYLQIDELQKMAAERSAELMEKKFDPMRWRDAIEEVLTSNATDTKMKKTILRTCLQNVEKVLKCPVVEALLEECEPVAWPLLKEIKDAIKSDAQKQSERIQGLTIKVEELHAQVVLSKELCTSSDNTREMWSQQYMAVSKEKCKLVDLISRYKICRSASCSTGFPILQLSSGGNVEYLRCPRCQCRHHPE